jgi:hypothetical protein
MRSQDSGEYGRRSDDFGQDERNFGDQGYYGRGQEQGRRGSRWSEGNEHGRFDSRFDDDESRGAYGARSPMQYGDENLEDDDRRGSDRGGRYGQGSHEQFPSGNRGRSRH